VFVIHDPNIIKKVATGKENK